MRITDEMKEKDLGGDDAHGGRGDLASHPARDPQDDKAPFALGPWQLEDDDSPAGCRIGIMSEGGSQIAEVLNFDDFPCLSGDDDCDAKCKAVDDEARANARLISAAPELYVRLADLIKIIDKAGLLNLSNGVQLGATIWYVKASDRLELARKAVEKAVPRAGTVQPKQETASPSVGDTPPTDRS